MSLHARLERDLAKGKIHFVDTEGSNVSTESEEGYLEDVEIHGNTWQNAENLADIRSVGTKVEGQELYEIPVVSCGKNLFDKNSSDNILGKYISTSGSMLTSDTSFITHYIRVLKGVTYYKNNTTGVSYYDNEKNFLGLQGMYTFTPTQDGYVRVNVNISDLDTFQLEIGATKSEYQEYQEDKLTILSPTQLEKVGDVADRIVCKDGVWGVEKNVFTKYFNGSDNWTYDANLKRFNVNLTDVVSKGFGKLYSNEYYWDNDSKLDKTAMIHLNTLYIHEFAISNSNEFNKYLVDNGIFIKYPTTNPTFIPLPHDQQKKLRTFADRTHIHFDTEIEPTLKAQVPKSLGATVNTHTTQIDNLNKELDRVKKLEESTVTTVTSSKAFTTVAETNGGYFEDVKIEGKTLVNLFQFKNKSDFYSLSYDSIMKPNSLSFIANSTYQNAMLNPKSTIKPSTTYTLCVDIVKNTLNDGKLIIANDNKTSQLFGNVEIKSNDIGFKIFKVQSREELSLCDKLLCTFLDKVATEGEIEVKILILEGDHTDKDISYFEGLKSVGQDVDEISVSSVNENLFNVDRLVEYCGGSVTDNVYCNINSNPSTRYPITIPKGSYVSWTVIEGGTNPSASPFIFIAEDGKNLTPLSIGKAGQTKGATFDKKIVGIQVTQWSEGYQLANIQIRCIPDPYNYIENKSDKKPILYFNPTTQTWEKPVLREWDSIEKYSDGKYYYHKRSEEVVLNGSEIWGVSRTTENTLIFGTTSNPIIKGDNGRTCVICSSFISVEANVQWTNASQECISINTKGQILVQIPKSKAEDLNGFKAWLQANPTTVVYQLAQEEVYECTNLDLITYSGETNLIVNSGAIQPRITLKVLSNVSNVVKLLQEKVSVLENKFIEGLKQVLAGDMMSLAHLLYPEDFENNHEIQTLEL